MMIIIITDTDLPDRRQKETWGWFHICHIIDNHVDLSCVRAAI